jgi:hypothetical protein
MQPNQTKAIEEVVKDLRNMAARLKLITRPGHVFARAGRVSYLSKADASHWCTILADKLSDVVESQSDDPLPEGVLAMSQLDSAITEVRADIEKQKQQLDFMEELLKRREEVYSEPDET